MTGPGGGRCPKCGRARADGAAACARCGLVFALWSQGKTPEQSTALDQEGELLWAALESHWTDASKHDVFLKHCAKKGRLPAAGRRYRERIDQDNDALAVKMQNRIVGMATAAFIPMRATPPTAVSRGRWFFWVVAMGAVAGVLAGLYFQAISG
jgi:hypothetical protein